MAYDFEVDPIMGAGLFVFSAYAENCEPIEAIDSAEIDNEFSSRTCLTIYTA